MNDPPDRYNGYSFPYMDDAEGLRALLPGAAVHREEPDLAVYLYRWVSGTAAFDVDWREATFTRETRVGQTLAVGDDHVENVGTVAIPMPTIEGYLTAAQSIAAPYHFLDTRTYPRLERGQHFRTNSVGTEFTVPSVPAGEYYLTAFIRDNGGPAQAPFPVSNNTAWSKGKVRIR